MFGLPIPAWLVTPIAYLLMATALVMGGMVWGQHRVYNEWIQSNTESALAGARIVEHQTTVTTQIQREYILEESRTKPITETIEREVTRYVQSLPADTACGHDSEWLRLHDAAATGTLPSPSGGTDAARAGTAAGAEGRPDGGASPANGNRELRPSP